MIDKYIDQFGSDKDYSRPKNSKACYLPLAMAIISFICFVVYLLSAFGNRSVIMCVIYLVPILSIIGLVFSFTTRDSKYDHYIIWLAGLTGCALSLFLMVLFFFGSMVALAQD